MVTGYEGTLKFYNPGLGFIKSKGIEYVIDYTDKLEGPFVYLLSARWHHAVENDRTGRSESISEITTSEYPVVVADFFFEQAKASQDKHSVANVKYLHFSDLLPQQPSENALLIDCAMNIFQAQRSGNLDLDGIFFYESQSSCNKAPKIIVPMGSGENWMPKVGDPGKVIFLDEPHVSLIENLDNRGDIRSYLFHKALAVCRIASMAGYRIITFSRDGNEKLKGLLQEFPFLEIINVGSWIPYGEMLRWYSQASLFFSFFPETHGYSIFENLQIGNGVISFSETVSPFLVRQMQNGILLSKDLSDVLSFEMIDAYYHRYARSGLRDKVRNESNRLYSTETFCHRLRQAITLSQLNMVAQ